MPDFTTVCLPAYTVTIACRPPSLHTACLPACLREETNSLLITSTHRLIPTFPRSCVTTANTKVRRDGRTDARDTDGCDEKSCQDMQGSEGTEPLITSLRSQVSGLRSQVSGLRLNMCSVQCAVCCGIICVCFALLDQGFVYRNDSFTMRVRDSIAISDVE
jgi:hypothetical protein